MVRRTLVVLATIATLAVAQDAPNTNNPAASIDATTTAESQEQKPEAQWTITAECRMILAPQALALRFIPKLTLRDTAAEAWNDLEKAIAADQAKLIASLVSRSSERQRTVSECVEEMRYPTEWDPPQLPNKIPEENGPEMLLLWPMLGFTPTAFETRNIGQSLEVESTINEDGSLIHCNIAAQHVRYLRRESYGAGRLPNGNNLSIDQPIFHTMRSITNVTAVNGQTLLLGVHKAPTPEVGYELFIMQIRAERNLPK